MIFTIEESREKQKLNANSTYIPQKWETSSRESYRAKVERPSISLPLPPSFGIEWDESETRILLNVRSKVNFFTRPIGVERPRGTTMDGGPADGSCAPPAADVFTPEVTLFYSCLAAVGERVRSISICKTDVEPRFPAGWPRVDTIRAWTGELGKLGNSWRLASLGGKSCLLAIII